MKNKNVYAAALDSELHHNDSLERFCKQFDSIADAFEWMKKEHTEEEIIEMLNKLGFNIITKKTLNPENNVENPETNEQDDWFHKLIKPKHLMDQKEAAAYLGTTVSSLNSLRYYGKRKIPFLRWGNRIRYRKEDLDEWIKSNVVDCDNRETYICKAGLK